MNPELAEAIRALATPPPAGARAVTSDLSIDESLLLHAYSWEPTDLVSGVCVQSVPYAIWNPAVGQTEPAELVFASRAVIDAFVGAAERLRHDCAQAGGQGVVGVEVELSIGRTEVEVGLVGTAVRPVDAGAHVQGRPFVTDLSTKDFVLLGRAGWAPVDLAYGASFVLAPYQGVRRYLSQVNQNIELTNLTQALQTAREQAMERLQRRALDEGADGIVDVSILDGPVGHASHVLAFVCYGTSVQLRAESHQKIEPELVVPLDDARRGVEARAVRTT